MRVFLATDHAGFETKEAVRTRLVAEEYTVDDLGARTFDPIDDYPAYMHSLALQVSRDSGSMGIAFGGSGQGEAIVLNRQSGIRAIVYPAANVELIVLGREHNNANVLPIGARFLSVEEVWEAVDLFLRTPFPGDSRHVRRLGQIDVVEGAV